MTNCACYDNLGAMKLTLIIPAYNEAKRLPAFLDEVLAYAKSHPEQILESIVVDDGSTDDTAGYVKERVASLGESAVTGPALKLIQLPHNRGKGAAVREGVMAAAGDYIVFTDADGATPISELPKMIEALKKHDVAVGNRWVSGAHVHKSTALRHFAGWIYKTYMSLFGLGGIDTMCGFKGYRKEIARSLFDNLLEERWLFDTEIAYKAVRHGYSIKNFPIEWESKDGSKLDSLTLMKSGFQILPLILKIRRHE